MDQSPSRKRNGLKIQPREQSGKKKGDDSVIKILKKCKNKFDCLIYEMFFIR